jgi:hypothetical protein
MPSKSHETIPLTADIAPTGPSEVEPDPDETDHAEEPGG